MATNGNEPEQQRQILDHKRHGSVSYYGTSPFSNTFGGSISCSLDTLYASPFISREGFSTNQASLNFIFAGLLNVIGIYSNLGNFVYPGNKLAQTASFVSSGGGNIQPAINFSFLPDTLYWIVINGSANYDLRQYSSDDVPTVLGASGLASANPFFMTYRTVGTDIYNAVMPDPFPSGKTLTPNLTAPAILFRCI